MLKTTDVDVNKEQNKMDHNETEQGGVDWIILAC
jgi:hypothetical protein